MDVTYLDHNASAPLPESLLAELEKFVRKGGGNPSSLHLSGRASRRLINDACEAIARYLDCDSEFLYWTSGASESNSWALWSAAARAREQGRAPRLLVSSIEHDSTLLAAKALSRSRGAHIEAIPVLDNGQVDVSRLRVQLEGGPWDLVSVMHSNNESGVLQPIEAVAAACRASEVPLHVDCVQSLGKVPLSLRTMGAMYTTFSAHKIGGLKGVGILAVQGEGRLLEPLVHGKQQKTLRGGTENPMGAALFARLLSEDVYPESLAQWHRDFEAELKRKIPGTVIHGESAPRLRNTTFVGFEGVDGDGILLNLDMEGICASSGSACTSGSLDPSHVLLAMGHFKAMARSSVRFSSGRSTAWRDFERVLGVLPEIVERVRKAGR